MDIGWRNFADFNPINIFLVGLCIAWDVAHSVVKLNSMNKYFENVSKNEQINKHAKVYTVTPPLPTNIHLVEIPLKCVDSVKTLIIKI